MPNILLVKMSSLGDVIQNLPLVADIRARQPQARIHWLVEEAFAPIVALHPDVEKVIAVALRRWRKTPFASATRREWHAARDQLRAEQYDAIIDTQGLLKSALLARVARGTRYGFGRRSAREPWASWFYHRAIDIEAETHAMARYRALAAAALGYRIDSAADFGIAAPAAQFDWLPAKPYVVLVHAASRDDKLWPNTAWRSLIEVIKNMTFQVILPWGSEAERQRSETLASAFAHCVVPPRLDLRQVAALLGGAKLVVGLDTGLTYLAIALDRPVVRLYCGIDRGLTRLYQPPHGINLGVDGITPTADAVIQATQQLLGARA